MTEDDRKRTAEWLRSQADKLAGLNKPRLQEIVERLRREALYLDKNDRAGALRCATEV